MKNWDKKRIKGASIGRFTAIYEVVPQDALRERIKLGHPELFKFEALSVGDVNGQAFFVPLDESSIETAEYIIRAINAYEGD